MGPSSPLLIIFALIGLGATALGVMGFRPEGIPFSQNTRITGRPGKIVGLLCVLLGFAILWWAGRVFGPTKDDAFAWGFVRSFPFGAAVLAVARIVWISRSSSGEVKSPGRRPKKLRKEAAPRNADGIIECPNCGKRLVDTAAEECRFCGKPLLPT